MKMKWHLITELPPNGFLKLVEDLDRLYHEIGEWRNAHIAFRTRDGKYDVNILTMDYEAMKRRVENAAFEKRYTEDV